MTQGLLRLYKLRAKLYKLRALEGKSWGCRRFCSDLWPGPDEAFPHIENTNKLLFFERSPPRGGTLRESGRDYLAPAAGYIWGGTLRESGRNGSLGGIIWLQLSGIYGAGH